MFEFRMFVLSAVACFACTYGFMNGGINSPIPNNLIRNVQSDELLFTKTNSLINTRRSVVMSNNKFDSMARSESSLIEELRKREILGNSNNKQNDNKKSEYEINLGKAIDTLRSDYPLLLDEPLDYSIYTDDILFRDPSGVEFWGIKTYQRLFSALRFFRNTFIDQIDTRFRIVYDWTRKQVRVNWHMTVTFKARSRHPYYVDCISVYHINDDGFVKGHVLETIIVNGEGSSLDLNHVMNLWRVSKGMTVAASVANSYTLELQSTLKTAFEKTANKLKESLDFWSKLPNECESFLDCDSPMECCDFTLFKVCCKGGIGIPIAEPKLVPIPVRVPADAGQGNSQRYPNYY